MIKFIKRIDKDNTIDVTFENVYYVLFLSSAKDRNASVDFDYCSIVNNFGQIRSGFEPYFEFMEVT